MELKFHVRRARHGSHAKHQPGTLAEAKKLEHSQFVSNETLGQGLNITCEQDPK